MFITPISNYSNIKQNKTNNYHPNVDRFCKTNSVSFGATVTRTVETMPKVKGLADLTSSIMEMTQGQRLSDIQTGKLKEIFDSVMSVIRDDVNANNPKLFIRVIAKDQDPKKASISYDCARGFLDTKHKYGENDSLELCFNKDGNLFSFTCSLFGIKGNKMFFENNWVNQIQQL